MSKRGKIQHNEHLGDLEEFLEKNVRLVHHTCNRFRVKALAVGIDPEEVFQNGMIGMMKAYEKFDPVTFVNSESGEGLKFSTYAVPTIVGEIQRFLRDYSPGVKYGRWAMEAGWKIIHNEWQDKSVKELMELLGQSERIVLAAIDFTRHKSPSSMDKTLIISTHGSHPVTLGESLADEEDFTEILVEDFLSTLSEVDRRIVELRLLDTSQAEIGKAVGVSQVQVSRILEKLKVTLSDYYSGNSRKKKKPTVKVKTVEPVPDKIIIKPRIATTKEEITLDINTQEYKIQLERVKQLLETTNLTYREISEQTGVPYASVGYHGGRIRNRKPAATHKKRIKKKPEVVETTLAKEKKPKPEPTLVLELTPNLFEAPTGMEETDVEALARLFRGNQNTMSDMLKDMGLLEPVEPKRIEPEIQQAEFEDGDTQLEDVVEQEHTETDVEVLARFMQGDVNNVDNMLGNMGFTKTGEPGRYNNPFYSGPDEQEPVEPETVEPEPAEQDADEGLQDFFSSLSGFQDTNPETITKESSDIKPDPDWDEPVAPLLDFPTFTKASALKPVNHGETLARDIDLKISATVVGRAGLEEELTRIAGMLSMQDNEEIEFFIHIKSDSGTANETE